MKRLDSLTGVRIFAALLVFGFHSVEFSKGSELAVFGAGMVGVSLFYVLSGFVMAWTARPDDTPGHFYRRRFARIYPSYLVAWLIALAILLTQGGFGWADLVPLTMLQAWVPMEVVYFAGSAVFWSLSCEAFFYLVFPFLHRLIHRLRTRSLALVGAGAAVASIGIAVLALPLPENEFTRWFIIIFPPLRLLEFIVGVVLGLLFSRGLRSPIPLSAAVALAAAGIYVSSIAPYSLSRFAVTLIPFVILVASLATSDLRDKPSIFRWKPIVALGNWSYAFYLLHAMVLAAAFAVFTKTGIHSEGTPSLIVWVELLAALAASTFAAWLLHTFVELPMAERLRPKASGRRLADDPVLVDAAPQA
ncbi:acyltransferase [Cryobacterium sp. N22]|uniref:acyltransferase family protein n=1 Tax=Cryobacterium sp. N22 TaxID=2048290 RepID=UPI001304AB25|nr:acyltransferase [Cryobacterium sp. N22]